MKKYFLPALAILLIGVFIMTSVSAPRMGGSPYASEDNALADLSGWREDSLDRTWSYVSANAAGNTFVVSATGDLTNIFRVAMRFRAKQGGGYEHFIIHYVEYVTLDNITKLTLFGGANGDLINAAITDAAFTTERFPAGFPIGGDEWSVEVVDTTQRSQSTPSATTWYNPGSTNQQIVVPVGLWVVSYSAFGRADASANATQFWLTLSTSNSTESDINFTRSHYLGVTGSTALIITAHLSASKDILLTSEQTYYLNIKTDFATVTSLYIGSSTVETIIRAVSGYY